LVSYTEGTQTEGVCQQGNMENISTNEG